IRQGSRPARRRDGARPRPRRALAVDFSLLLLPSPSPSWSGRGGVVHRCAAVDVSLSPHDPTPTPPHKGEGKVFMTQEIFVTQPNYADAPLQVRSSRLWALFHFSLTRIIFPTRMI